MMRSRMFYGELTISLLIKKKKKENVKNVKNVEILCSKRKFKIKVCSVFI